VGMVTLSGNKPLSLLFYFVSRQMILQKEQMLLVPPAIL